MKKIMIMLAWLCASAPLLAAAAGQKDTQPRSQCMARCKEDPNAVPERQQQHEEALQRIRSRKQAETDRQKVAQLEAEEQREIARYLASHEQLCTDICRHFPEQ